MNPLLKTVVNYKLKTMNPRELLEFAKKYDIEMTRVQARQVVLLLRKDSFDLFNEDKRLAILNTIAEKIDPALSESMDRLFQRFVKSQSKK
ncbi:DUF2624 family protein [Pullulanibacillus sp. KACC 23026]|uniref:DUF2624 family protein n=1 Tax=Pullulanibacillus sp. KACC 23026 TaxID=3028315 RepID=UPI0023B1A175|nr:DUF2624 family protein [Pullulanibacillus sp. KACC 23026]WEG14253.1 DUF2624 family protein [Pullulanibacillus sp. KACC 23026]